MESKPNSQEPPPPLELDGDTARKPGSKSQADDGPAVGAMEVGDDGFPPELVEEPSAGQHDAAKPGKRTDPEEVRGAASRPRAFVPPPGLEGLFPDAPKQDSIVVGGQPPTATGGARSRPVGSGSAFVADLPVAVVSIADIDFGTVRHSPEELDALAGTVKDLGAVHLPVLRKSGKRYRVVSGNGRIAARRKLGESTFRVIVMPEDASYDDAAELWGIVENVGRVDLPPHERDVALARWKQIYEGLHPDTAGSGARRKAGKRGAAARHGVALEAASNARRSAAAPAAATGQTERNVRLAEARVRRSAPETWNAYAKGELAPTQVDEIVRLPVPQQATALESVRGSTRAETRDRVKKQRAPTIAAPGNATPSTKDAPNPDHDAVLDSVFAAVAAVDQALKAAARVVRSSSATPLNLRGVGPKLLKVQRVSRDLCAFAKLLEKARAKRLGPPRGRATAKGRTR